MDAYFWARQKVVFTFQQLKKRLVYPPLDKNLALIPTFKILTRSLVGHPVDVMMWTRESYVNNRQTRRREDSSHFLESVFRIWREGEEKSIDKVYV